MVHHQIINIMIMVHPFQMVEIQPDNIHQVHVGMDQQQVCVKNLFIFSN
jgi:hypothetical protein